MPKVNNSIGAGFIRKIVQEETKNIAYGIKDKVQNWTALQAIDTSDFTGGEIYIVEENEGTRENGLYRWNQNTSQWDFLSGLSLQDLDEVNNGTTYGRVLNTELENGQIKRIRAVIAGANVDGDDIKDAVDKKHSHNTSKVSVYKIDQSIPNATSQI